MCVTIFATDPITSSASTHYVQIYIFICFSFLFECQKETTKLMSAIYIQLIWTWARQSLTQNELSHVCLDDRA